MTPQEFTEYFRYKLDVMQVQITDSFDLGSFLHLYLMTYQI